MRGHRGAVTCLSFFDRDTCVAAGDEQGKVVLHRVADAPSDDEVRRGVRGAITRQLVMIDDRHCVLQSSQGTFRIRETLAVTGS